MSMIKTLEEIRGLVGTESYNMYPGELCGEEMQDIDNLVTIMDVGNEGDVFLTFDMAKVEAAYENDGTVKFSDFFGFGNESVSEKVSLSYDRIKTFFKKICAAIVKFIKRISNIITNQDIALAKYGKVIDKLDRELARKVFSDTSKSITINPLKNLDGLVHMAYCVDEKTLDAQMKVLEKKKGDWDEFYDFLLDDMIYLSGLSHDMNGEGTVDTTDEFIDAVKANKIKARYEHKISFCKPDESESFTLLKAKKELQSRVKSISKYMKSNIKIQSKLRSFIDLVEKIAAEFVKNGELKKWEDEDSQVRIREMESVDLMGPAMAQIQAGRTALFKHTVKCLNTLILNMRKLINE